MVGKQSLVLAFLCLIRLNARADDQPSSRPQMLNWGQFESLDSETAKKAFEAGIKGTKATEEYCAQYQEATQKCFNELLLEEMDVCVNGGLSQICRIARDDPEAQKLIDAMAGVKLFEGSVCSEHLDQETGNPKDEIGKCAIFKFTKYFHESVRQKNARIYIEYQNKKFVAYRSAFTYRDLKWGMTHKEVIKRFPKLKTIEGKNFLWEGTTAGIDSVMALVFTSGRLAVVHVILKPEFSHRNKYLQQYAEISTLLEKKYGVPERKKQEPDVLAKGLMEQAGVGAAIQMGELELSETWELEDTFIIHKLESRNYELVETIGYSSKVFNSALHEEQSTKRQEDL